MKKKKLIFILAVLLAAALCLSGCKSTKAFEGNASLTFLILDQNDRAVEDYEITISYQRKILDDFEEKAGSNQKGLCLFYNIPAASYTMSGQKNGYTRLLPQELNFDRPDELLCYRVLSFDYVFDLADQYFKNDQYQKALDLLESLCVLQDPYLQNTLSFYTAYACAKLGQKEKAGLLVQNIVDLEDPAFQASKYRQAIKEKL